MIATIDTLLRCHQLGAINGVIAEGLDGTEYWTFACDTVLDICGTELTLFTPEGTEWATYPVTDTAEPDWQKAELIAVRAVIAAINQAASYFTALNDGGK